MDNVGGIFWILLSGQPAGQWVLTWLTIFFSDNFSVMRTVTFGYCSQYSVENVIKAKTCIFLKHYKNIDILKQFSNSYPSKTIQNHLSFQNNPKTFTFLTIRSIYFYNAIHKHLSLHNSIKTFTIFHAGKAWERKMHENWVSIFRFFGKNVSLSTSTNMYGLGRVFQLLCGHVFTHSFFLSCSQTT